MKKRKHILITGTGRAGTTFLVQLLTNLGLDTGFDKDNIVLYKHARAGLEHDIRDEHSPYIVKCPWFIDHADEVLARSDIIIDHIYIPIRDVKAVAKSRWQVVKDTRKEYSLIKKLFKPPSNISGGLWGTNNKNSQDTVLTKKLYNLLFSISGYQIPVTFIRYPKLTQDGNYLHKKLQFILNDITLDEFINVYYNCVNPEIVHKHNSNDI